MSIFVIDEHPLMREAIVAVLARMGHPAVELGDVAAATEAAGTHGTPQLICIETSVGNQNGWSALHQLHNQFPDAAIVVLSASTTPDAESRALEAGASAFLHKSAQSDAVALALRPPASE